MVELGLKRGAGVNRLAPKRPRYCVVGFCEVGDAVGLVVVGMVIAGVVGIGVVVDSLVMVLAGVVVVDSLREPCLPSILIVVLSDEVIVVPASVDTRFSSILTLVTGVGTVVSVIGVTVKTSVLADCVVVRGVDVSPSGTRPVVVDVVVASVVVVAVVVSTEDEAVVTGVELGVDEVEDSVDEDAMVEDSGNMDVLVSVVWPIPEPAVLWAVADDVSWKRATTVGVTFSRFGVVWGELVVSLGVLVVLSMVDDSVVDVSEDWLVENPVSSVILTSSGAMVVIDNVVASSVSIPVVSVLKGVNCVVDSVAGLVATSIFTR